MLVFSRPHCVWISHEQQVWIKYNVNIILFFWCWLLYVFYFLGVDYPATDFNVSSSGIELRGFLVNCRNYVAIKLTKLNTNNILKLFSSFLLIEISKHIKMSIHQLLMFTKKQPRSCWKLFFQLSFISFGEAGSFKWSLLSRKCWHSTCVLAL